MILAFRQKLKESEENFHVAQQQWDEKWKRMMNDLSERDIIIKTCNSEYEVLLKEKTKLDNALKVCF